MKQEIKAYQIEPGDLVYFYSFNYKKVASRSVLSSGLNYVKVRHCGEIIIINEKDIKSFISTNLNERKC